MSTTKRKKASLTVGLQIENCRTVNGVRVSREKQRIGVHQLIEDDSLVTPRHPDADVTQAHPFKGRCGNEVEKDLDAAKEVEVVVYLLCCIRGGDPIHEIECPDASLNRVWRKDRLWNLVVEAGGWGLASGGSLRVGVCKGQCADEGRGHQILLVRRFHCGTLPLFNTWCGTPTNIADLKKRFSRSTQQSRAMLCIV
jgi:hypothetical protein